MTPARLAALLAALLLAIPSIVAAQDRPARVPTTREPRTGWWFEWEDHPSWRYGEKTRIDFRARVQVDARRSDVAIGEPDTFDATRRRIGVDGRIADLVDFQVEGELRDDEPWRDVYVDYRQFGAAQLQAGHFKLPFSLDENTSASDRDFVYRSLAASQLAPGRDRGAMLHGRVVRGIIRYELGLFNHDGRNARTNNPDRSVATRTAAGRIAFQPFRNSKSRFRDIHAAIAFTGGDVPEGLSGLRGQTALDASFFPAEIWVRGQRRRTGVEARWRPGPFSVSGEFMHVSTERLGQSVEGTDLPALVADGWYVSGSWIVTGQQKAGNPDRPRRSILRGGVGAVEVAVRLESLAYKSRNTGDLPSSSPRAEVVLGNRDRAITMGVNWYLVRGIKLQANVIREALSTPELAPAPSQPDFWSGVVRVQLTL